MSSQRRINASRANGAKSHGPTTPEGKKRSSQNALDHGLFAECVLLNGEGAEEFEALMQVHLDRFQPDEVELSVIEQMCAAQWRLGRVLTMETQALNKQLSLQPAGPNPYALAEAFESAAASPSMALLQRYESRLQLVYQRAVRTLKLLRTIDGKNEPSPITEHPEPPPQPADSEPLGEACVSLPQSSHRPLRSAPLTPNVPANPPAAPANPPQPPKEPGGAV